MQTTAYGYKIPDTGDLSKGVNGWMAAQDFNWDRMSGHTHNGTDSALLAVSAFSPYTTTVAAGDWVANTNSAGWPVGGYMTLVTVPAGVTELNDYMVKFLISTVGNYQYQQVLLDYVRITGTTFRVFTNDNTLDLLCVFR